MVATGNAQEETRVGRRKGRAKRSGWRTLGEYTMVIVVALVLSALIRAFIMQAFWIPSSSMEDTLQVGDNVVTSRLTPAVFDLERGDVIVFSDTQGWLPPAQKKQGAAKYLNDALVFVGLRPAGGTQHLVKRLIGLPGDRVKCCNAQGQLEVNGKSVAEPYLAPGADNRLLPFDVTVPENHLWVMGDNRNYSADSRVHLQDGKMPFVNVNDVVGRAKFIAWPVSHWSDPNHNEVFAGVPNAKQK
ncbi:signal peptidase I [Gleimia hominis]|uniref:Signal peptidase I n=1 Tax=Gleimia hominis TaxID=595468 RepID=A0ABU3IC22_9ACTO|nr:signal peptidase I [Gleimia hominis]MDT3767922.1 signal peptidase I [Gleimia hominis]